MSVRMNEFEGHLENLFSMVGPGILYDAEYEWGFWMNCSYFLGSSPSIVSYNQGSMGEGKENFLDGTTKTSNTS